MKTSTPVAEILNHKGGLAQELQATAIRAYWLGVVCTLWLSHHNDDYDIASREEPSYDLPKQLDEDGRFARARKECKAWEPGSPAPHWPTVSVTKTGKIRKVAGRATNPRPSQRWDWPWVFEYWFDGGLDRGLRELLDMLPVENVRRVKEEMVR